MSARRRRSIGMPCRRRCARSTPRSSRRRVCPPSAASFALSSRLQEDSGMADPATDIDRHYGRGGLLERLLAALREAGKDVEHLTIDDLAPVDEFHSRRRVATAEL